LNWNLIDIGLCKAETESARYFHIVLDEMEESTIENPDFFENIVETCSNLALKQGKTEGSLRGLRGNWFEFAIGLVLINKGIIPFYHKASLSHIPNIIFDFIIFTTEHGPICLSAKTSLRERYKQTDLEAMALKYVHRRSVSYLLTINEEKTVRELAKKINKKDVLGLDGVYRSGEIHNIIARFRGYSLIKAPKGDIIRGNIIEAKV